MEQASAGGPAAAPTAQPSSPVPAEPLQGFFPWRRFFARHLDMVLLAVVLTYSILFLFGADSRIAKFDRTSDVLGPMATLLLLVPIEAALIAAFGTTFGKALYAIRVEGKEQPKPGYRRALLRSFQVYLRGMALGIPIIHLFAMVIGYGTLKDSYTTTWDREAKTRVLHYPLGIARIVALVAIWGVILAILTSVFWE